MLGKKRRDKERDPSSFQRLQKAGKTALALGTGAVFLHNSTLGKKFTREISPALIKTGENIRKDLLGKDKKNLLLLGDTVNKHLSPKAFKETILDTKNKKLDINPMSSDLYKNLLKKTEYLKSTGKRSLDRDLETNYEKNVIAKITEEVLNKHIIKNEKYEHVTRDHINQIVQGTLKDVTDVTIENGIIQEKLSKTFNTLRIDEEDVNEILKTINRIKKKDLTEKKIKAYKKDNSYLEHVIEKLYYNDNLIKHNKTIYDKIDAFQKVFLNNKLKSDKIINSSEAATVEDFLKDFDKISKVVNINDFEFKTKEAGKNTEIFNFVDELKKMVEANENSKDLIVSKGLRKAINKDGETFYFSSQDNIDFINKIKSKIKDTLPYKILFRGLDDKSELPSIAVSHMGNKTTLISHMKMGDKISQRIAEDIEDNINPSMNIFINGMTYFGREKDGIISFDETNAIESKLIKGFKKHEYYNITGHKNFAIPERYENKISKLLDINQDGEFNFSNIAKRMFYKFQDPNWEFNSISNVENTYLSGLNPGEYIESILSSTLKGEDLIDEDRFLKKFVEASSRLHQDEAITSKKLQENITGVTDEVLKQLIESDEVSDKHKKMLEHLFNNDIMEFLKVAIHEENESNTTTNYKNDKLNILINRWLTNTDEMIYSAKDIRRKGFRIPLLEMPFDENTRLDILGQLRIETVKDVMLELSEDSINNSFFSWIDSLDLTPKDIYSLKDLSISAIFDKATQIDKVKNFSEDIGLLYIRNNELTETLMNNPAMLSHFEANLGTIKSKFGLLSKGSTYNLNEKYYSDEDNLAIIKKSSIGKILTTDINNNIKFNGEAVIDTLKEFTAGRNNTENITDLTLMAQYSMTRLNYAIQELGLGLSSDSLGGPIDTFKNIALKRVLPIMVAGKGLDILNYEAEKITGTSLKGAAANSLANLDIGMRNILDFTGLSRPLNYFAETSVISEYLTGDRKFKTAEEEREWYQEGYSPVRKGRFWSFGSSSEYRGGSITYWQPNYLKRAHSNYYDISVYGSIDEKWKHSWIPTPQHPLSTIRAFLDPYWLERKHLKENDRPYPLTGKMFSEGTAWGAFLNPTIGQALKPVTMLPEARRRLGRNGIDAKATIERLNTRIKQRGNKNDDLVIIEGTDIRNAEYVPYGNPENNELNLSITNGEVEVKGIDFINGINNIKDYEAPDGLSYTEEINNYNGQIRREQRRILSKGEQFFIDMQNTEFGKEEAPKMAIKLISNINEKIKNKTKPVRNVDYISNVPDKKEGTYIYKNLVNERLNLNDEYYKRYDTKEMVNKSIMYDYKRDFLYSQKQIHGIYGFLSDQFFGSKTYTYRYENAGKMSSFTRKFWDANIGGLGGGIMEIARRFFPSEDRSRIDINPLRNNMPEWIPDSYWYGDPYTEIPKGEMRLPGKGYESLNKLHPDAYGEYGAFDRYKILADIAPNSSEYKKWKNIAQNTITDEKLKKQMEDISIRVAKMSGNHEFYNYNYIHTNTEYRKGIVKSVKNGQIQLVDNQNLTLAGIITNENTSQALSQMLTPGQEINYKTYKDVKANTQGESIIEAVVYNEEENNENINQKLIELGAAQENREDFSPLAISGKQSSMQEVLGSVQEIIAHAKIPIIHNKFLKVETPLESYKSETYYGSNFKTWDHPIKGFITPAFNEQSGKSLINQALSVGYAFLHFDKMINSDSKLVRYASNVLLTTLNPSAFVGGSVGYGMRLATGKSLSSGKSSKSDFQIGAQIGATIGAVKWGLDNADNPLKAMAYFAMAGASSSQIFYNVEEFSKKYLNKNIKKFGLKQGALVGSLVGLSISAIKNQDFDSDRMFRKWAPKDTKKKWELDEYFDRLNYIKYQGLYKVASARAAIFENSNIRQIFKDIDKNKKKLAKLNRQAMKLAQKNNGNISKNREKIDRINQKRLALEEQNKIYLTADKYTKAAIAYKKKAESTIYGLDETSTKDELLASVPDQYKDHFKAFMEITDKKEQEKILKYVPKYLQRPLQVAWGQKPNEVKSNRVFFKNHKLPSMAWKGWKPNINLKHVKMKTIENEGMLFSDFGYYESEKSKPSYEMAPSIKDYDKKSGQFYRTNLIGALHGFGINHCNVSVEPTSSPGMWIVGDIKDTAKDISKVIGYESNSIVQNVIGSIF